MTKAEKLLKDYDTAVADMYRLSGHHTGHGVGKVVSHRERIEQFSIVDEAKQKLVEAINLSDDIMSFLNDFTSHAECGFLDEIPSFKPDCYYHPLVKQAAQLLIQLDPNAFDEYTKRIING